MDASTAGIILLFVVTIFSSLGGNRNYTVSYNSKPESNTQIVTPAPVPSSPVSNSLDWHFAGAGDMAVAGSIQKYITKYRSPDEAAEISSSIVRHAQTYDVNPKLVAALIARESRFNPRARSSSGAMGLGQLLPSTCKTVGVEDGFDIDQNAKGTVRYMKYLLDKFQAFSDPVSFSIAGYLEGPNGVARNRGYSSHAQLYINDIFEVYNKI
ncbi:MAG: lytic transglycosylase domain-containing protein [Candidatus Margulisiibacteriota bacterium]